MPDVTVRLRKVTSEDDPGVDVFAETLQDITLAAVELWGIPLAEVRLTHHGRTPTSLRMMQDHDEVCVHASDEEARAFMEAQPHRSGCLYFIDRAFDCGYVNDLDVVKVFGRPARLVADSWDVDGSPRGGPPVVKMLEDSGSSPATSRAGRCPWAG